MILGVAPTRYRLIDILDDSTSYCWDGLGKGVPFFGARLSQVRRRDAQPSARQQFFGSKAAIECHRPLICCRVLYHSHFWWVFLIIPPMSGWHSMICRKKKNISGGIPPISGGFFWCLYTTPIYGDVVLKGWSGYGSNIWDTVGRRICFSDIFRIRLGQMKSLWKHDQSYHFFLGGEP